MTKICVIHGHPDVSQPHFCAALGQAYIEGARASGHEVSEITIGALDFGFLKRPEDFASAPSAELVSERQKIKDAEHVVLIYPLWLGGAPAMVKGFMEQIACGGFLLSVGNSEKEFPKAQMKGKSMRIIVTMGMPGLIYKVWFGANSLKGLERGIFGMAGFKPIRHTIIGIIGTRAAGYHDKWLGKVRGLGQKAS